VKFTQVNSEIPSAGRGQITLGVNRQGRVVALISKEERRTSSLVWGIVVHEFRERKKCGPVVLLVVAVAMQVLFQGLVNPFRLAVTLWVVAGSEVELHVQHFSKTAEEVGHELRTSIGSTV